MTTYRLYLTDNRGHFLKVQVLECDTDEAATAEAERQAPEQRKELWCGARMVKAWQALAPADSGRSR